MPTGARGGGGWRVATRSEPATVPSPKGGGDGGGGTPPTRKVFAHGWVPIFEHGAPLAAALEDLDYYEQSPAEPRLLVDKGAGYTALGSFAYADNTQAVASGVAAVRGTTVTTEELLQVTGQDV